MTNGTVSEFGCHVKELWSILMEKPYGGGGDRQEPQLTTRHMHEVFLDHSVPVKPQMTTLQSG